MNREPKIFCAAAFGAAIGFSGNSAAQRLMFPKNRIRSIIKIGETEFPYPQGILPLFQSIIAGVSEKTVNAILKSPKVLPGIQDFLNDRYHKKFILDFAIRTIYVTAASKSVNEMINMIVKYDSRQAAEVYLKDLMSRIIVNMTDKEFLSDLITNEGIKIIKELTRGTVFERLLNERIFASLANAIGTATNKFIDSEGTEKLVNVAFMEINSLMDLSLPEILKELSIDEDEMRRILAAIYDTFINEIIGEVIENIDFAGIVKNALLSLDFEKFNLFLNTKLESVLKLSNIIMAILGAVSGAIAFKIIESDT